MKIIQEPQQKCNSLIFNTLQRLVDMINLTNIHSYTKYSKSEGILGHDFSNWKSKKQEYIITACIDMQSENALPMWGRAFGGNVRKVWGK